MSVSPPGHPASNPLSYQNMQELSAARAGGKKVRRAIRVALFDGWTLAFFACLTVLFSIGSLSSMLIGLILGGIAAIELYAASRLRKLDPGACKILGYNQLALAALIIIYAASQLVPMMMGHSPLPAEVTSDPAAAQLLDSSGYGQVINLLYEGTYAGMILFAIFSMGSLSLYYFTRTKHVRAYVQQTPQWIIDMQRQGVSV